MADINTIVEQLSGLTVLETSELVKALEAKYYDELKLVMRSKIDAENKDLRYDKMYSFKREEESDLNDVEKAEL